MVKSFLQTLQTVSTEYCPHKRQLKVYQEELCECRFLCSEKWLWSYCLYTKQTQAKTFSSSESQKPKGTYISIILCPRSWLQASHLQMADLTVLMTSELQNYHVMPCKVGRKRSRDRKINIQLFHYAFTHHANGISKSALILLADCVYPPRHLNMR